MLAMLTADAVALIRGLDFPRKARANIFLQAPSASSPPGTAVADEDQPSFLSDTAEPPLLTWGGFEGQGSNSFPSLATLRASYAWSLTDVELEELQAFQDELTAATESYLTDPQIRRLRLAVEVETLARMYLQALQLGEPPLLSPEQMHAVHAQFHGLHYGQSDQSPR